MALGRKTYWCFAHQMRFLMGCSLGITLSLILMPFIEERCLVYEYRNYERSRTEYSGTTNASSEDYALVLNLKSQQQRNSGPVKRQISRPRYYSTELNIREKLFVAVLSSSSTIFSFGSSLNRTLSKHVDKIVFFAEGGEQQNVLDPSFVSFSDQNAVLAPFYMLQHIAKYHTEDFDFFFFAKDTTHIRGHKLMSFVHSISVSQNVHVGQNMDEESLYCTVDAGILLSRSVLKKTIEGLDWCIEHAFSNSNSNNLGRCILHGTHEPCVPIAQGLKYISHPLFQYDNLESSMQKTSWPKDLKHAITLYKVAHHFDHYMIHNYYCQQELIDNQHQFNELKLKISSASHLLMSNMSEMTWPIGVEPPFSSGNRFDVISWTYFNESHSFLKNDLVGMATLKGFDKVEISNIIQSAIAWSNDHNSMKYIFIKLLNGYRRFDPTRGIDYVMDMVFLDDATGKHFVKRIEAIRPLNKVEIIPVPFVTEHSRIILVLVVRLGENTEALNFLEEYEKKCLQKQENTVLLLIFLYGPQDLDNTFITVKNQISSLTSKYKSTGAKIAWLSIKTIGRMPPMFAIIDLVSRKLAYDSLILICKIGMEIHPAYLNRVRMNTILMTQVFFPIPYVQYHPSIPYKHLMPSGTIEVKKDFGHFNHLSYSHCSFYLSDYVAARKRLENVPLLKTDKDLKDQTLYVLDWDIREVFIKSSLHIMRAVEPDLRETFNHNFCDSSSSPSDYTRCLEEMEIRLGSKSDLAAAILTRNHQNLGDDIQNN